MSHTQKNIERVTLVLVIFAIYLFSASFFQNKARADAPANSGGSECIRSGDGRGSGGCVNVNSINGGGCGGSSGGSSCGG